MYKFNPRVALTGAGPDSVDNSVQPPVSHQFFERMFVPGFQSSGEGTGLRAQVLSLLREMNWMQGQFGHIYFR